MNPVPRAALRRGPFRDGAFPSELRSERLSAWLGLWLGVAFGICFLTGIVSHGAQEWAFWPSRPVQLYRVTQGVHVATGYVCVPLLLAKFWAVYPKLFTWPPARDVGHAVSRGALFLLVASALVQVVSGVLNTARWYAFGFFFTTVHYWSAWTCVGALLIHVGSQIAVLRRELGRTARPPQTPPTAPGPGQPRPPSAGAATGTNRLSRRTLLGAVGTAAGVVTLATAGQTVPPLARISLLAPRQPHRGPQSLPVNRTAAGAGIPPIDASYRLTCAGPTTTSLTLDALHHLDQHTVTLPITCVEGWSATADWTGVRIRDLLDLAGFDPDAPVRVVSLQRRGNYRSSVLHPNHHRDPLTLLALHLDGEPLAPDHGYPARLIAPNRPGVQQTKWVTRVERLA
ncbi:molybdopterin-dependent oxidoreductase [Cryptosporangium phraense]|uniref:Molybdopterin-dependent oxidoreductase n=2 Tax=Cryptosporangium phraense TaxID=2593070 RepID=A0A545AP63_9ACTN|nr:molybdopterin-dependent oxidoreductase [Cryptosporangium phraense]